MPDVTLQLAVAEDARGHIAYAAAFIHPAVAAVRVDGTAWHFRLHEAVAPGVLEAGLKTLAERFRSLPGFEPAPVFKLDAPADRDSGAVKALIESRAIQEIHPGLYVYREPVSSLVRFLDHAILARFAKPFGAREESYPNCIPLGDLGKAQHFSSFPEHLHFLTHLTQDLGVLDAFAADAKAKGHDVRPQGEALSAVQLVNNPSTCYHCYAARTGTAIAANIAVTAITKCHRFEAANHADFGRLLEFSLREVIFLGHPDFVRETRERTLALMQALATDWRLHGELLPSNDPFFTSDFAAKAQQQQRMAMKFEYRAAIPGQRKKLAIMSSNLHGVTFAKSFAMRREGGPLHTGCLGFGLERLALALLAQHGADPAAWPAGLRADYQAWRRVEPLGA